jgi:hypothetical protein
MLHGGQIARDGQYFFRLACGVKNWG